MELTKSLVTYDDYLTLPADGRKYEIIEGALFMTPAPTTDHQKVSSNLERLFYEFLNHHPDGEVYHAPTDVVFSMTEVVQPDIFFVLKERKGIITKRNIVAAPDLTIEIASESSGVTDRTTKKALYEKHGVKEYWIVDPYNKLVLLYVLRDNHYIGLHPFAEGDVIESEIFPELKITVDDIFSGVE